MSNEPYVTCTPQRWDAVVDTMCGNIVFADLDQIEMLWFLKLLQKAGWLYRPEKPVEAIIKPSAPPRTEGDTDGDN